MPIKSQYIVEVSARQDKLLIYLIDDVILNPVSTTY